MFLKKDFYLSHSLHASYFYYCLVLFVAFGHSFHLHAQQANENSKHLHIEATPSWVIERAGDKAEFVPVDEISNGVFYQLLDNQIKVDKTGFRTAYSRYVETVVNQTGVEDSSQINLSFDPLYQKLSLNTLVVIRDGKRIDRINDAKMSVFSRETDLDRQIYSGRLTLNILLDDIQAGDTIDYSYTRHGANPVYKNLFSWIRSLNWSVPVYNQNVRVLWGKPTPLHVETRNINPNIETREIGEFTEYQINLNFQETVNAPSEVPYWYSPYGRVHFNETENWADVVEWAQPMYQFGPSHVDVIEVANQIKQSFSSPSEQITAALKYTQDKIRYVGLEMGENSHMPTAPNETLALKYGDCKDKASLFIAILSALDIEAFPALVDTDETKLLAELPAGVNVFNHVIVWLELAGKQFWLDPTLSNQTGNLENLYQPDYGYALVLKQGNDKLTSMEKEENPSFMQIKERFEIPAKHESPVLFSVTTKYKGYGAMKRLWQLEQDGKKSIADEYEVYYQRTYPSLTTHQEMTIETDQKSGEVIFNEAYSIAEFWKMGDEHWETDFYPTEIRESLFKPKQSQRNGPLYFHYPENITSTLEVVFEEDGWDFDPEQFEEDNDFFNYSSALTFNNRTLTIVYQYSAKTDHIPQDKITEYMAARDRVRSDASYGILKYVKNDTASTAPDDESNEPWLNWVLALMVIYALGILYIIAEWQIESNSRPTFPESQYYPIHTSKFLFLSVISFGIYDAYWMYRNWKAIKTKTSEYMMPFWRGIFVVFWIYPLYSVLKQDHQEHASPHKITPTWIAALLALSYFILAIANGVVDSELETLVLLFSGLLLLPFVAYINLLNKHTPEALNFNSRWRIRHYVATLLFVPFMLFAAASQTSILPSGEVVSHSQLWDRDIKFFYRQKLVPVNEEVTYFYSDAYWDIKTDGNGFSNTQVFSYWEDENNIFQKEIATFADITSIEVEYSEDEFENTIVTITRSDDSDFLLFVSNTNKGDKRFVKELKKRWKAVKQQ